MNGTSPRHNRQRRDWARLLLSAYVVLFTIFLLAPIVSVVVVSFSSASFITFPVPGWSLRWYERSLSYRPFTDALQTSLELAVCAALLASALAVPAALTLARSRALWARTLANLLLAPVSIPAIVLGFSLLYYLAGLGLGLSFAALLIAHTVVSIPYIVRTVLATYRGIPSSLEEAASILGASRAQILLHTTLPLIRPGIFAGMLFAVLTSLDNLPLSFFFGNASTSTLPVVMLNYMENQFDPSIAAISTVQMLVAITSLLVLDRVYGIERLTAA